MAGLAFNEQSTGIIPPVGLAFGPAIDPDQSVVGYPLDFSGEYTSPTGYAALRFGPEADPGDQQFNRTGTLQDTLAVLRPDITGSIAIAATLDATLPGLSTAIAGQYDQNVFRGPSLYLESVWEPPGDASPRTAIPWVKPARPIIKRGDDWEQADPVTLGQAFSINSLPRQRTTTLETWEHGKPLVNTLGESFDYLPRRRSYHGDVWENAQPVSDNTSSKYTHPPRADTRRQIIYEAALRIESLPYGFPFGTAVWLPLSERIVWEEAIQRPYGLSVLVVPPVQPPDAGYQPARLLNFRCPFTELPFALRFGVDPCPEQPRIIVPIRRVYFVVSSAALIRVSDGAEIPTQSIGLSIDVDSFAWSLNATLLGPEARALISNTTGEPVEVQADINGQTWRALIDKWGVSRSFGQRSITVSGRGLGAYLAAPYAPLRTYTETQQRLAQQLAAQELPQGWTLDWQLDDWLVPAGAWSYDSKTPISALSAIAEAAGGYLQSAMATKTITIAHRYPVAPWDWVSETPDISLPIDVLTKLGEDWEPSQPANNIYVSGRNQGVLVQVRRDGTAGDNSLPLIVDPLITEAVAGRQRGRAEIAGSQRKANQTLSLPISNDLAGLILPGKMLEVTGDEGGTWRGLVRSTAVNSTLNPGLSVRQQINVERQYPETV